MTLNLMMIVNGKHATCALYQCRIASYKIPYIDLFDAHVAMTNDVICAFSVANLLGDEDSTNNNEVLIMPYHIVDVIDA